MKGLTIIAGLGAAVILTACGSSAANQGPAAPPSTSSSSGTAASGSNGGTGGGNGTGTSSGNGGGVDGSNSGGTPKGAGHKPKKGIISGVMSMVTSSIGAGSSQPGMHSIPGTVTFTSLRHGTFTTQADSNGRFSMKLPIGSYHLTGQSPKVMVNGAEERCILPSAINVGIDKNVHVEINCIVP